MLKGVEHGVLTMEIRFSHGISPFGSLILAGSQNWFELLGTTPAKRDKRRRKRRDELTRPKSNEEKIVETKTPEKKLLDECKPDLLAHTPSKPRVPDIKITRASNENVFELCLTSSSDEESDNDDDDNGEEFVYECPGLAASGEDMTVENPLFNEKLFKNSYRTPELPKKYWKDVFSQSI